MSDVLLDVEPEVIEEVTSRAQHWASSRVLGATNCLYELPDGSLCDAPLPVKGDPGWSANRKFCEPHKAKPKRGDKKPASVKQPTQPTVTVSLGAPAKPKKDQSQKEIYAEGATRLLQFLPMVTAMASDEVCTTALTEGLPMVAAQLAEVAVYHPGLAKILSPGEATGEAMAWVGLVIAVAPIIIAILVHHNLLPEKMAATLGAVLGGAVAAAQ